MSSESGDIAEADDNSGAEANVDSEPMVVDEHVAIAGNESKPEEADDASASETPSSVIQGKGDAEESKESVSENAESKEHIKDTVENESGEETQTDSKSDSLSDYDILYNASENYEDSGSEKELKALRSDMGNSKSKKGSNANGKKASSYQESSSDEYEEPWKRPWRSKEERKKKTPWSFTRRWSEKDTEYYRNGYPGKKDHQSQKLNIEFYTNKVRSKPDGDYIDIIHKDWFGDYRKLEVHHGYIQWLFPIRESGMNYHAQELQLHEAKTISGNRIAHKRVLTSYKMMLDFYGMKMKNETGELERAENYKERFAHLNRSMHNYLRITRILKSLGELDYEHLKVPFVRFVLKEALEKKTLDKTVNSCYNYWMETIKDDKDREELKDYAHELLSSDEN